METVDIIGLYFSQCKYNCLTLRITENILKRKCANLIPLSFYLISVRNESGIFLVNAYRNENIIYFITPPHSKRVCLHGLECPYGEYIFTPSLFCQNTDLCVENCICILYGHFVRIQHL